jgi:hypothetical protein
MSDEQHGRRTAAALPHSGSRRIRSRSRQREAQQPRRQLRSHTPAAAAIEAAYGNHPQSISRLHDDELLCVLPFLELKDLAQLVRCSRRFNGVARKERSRGLHLEGDASFALPPSSTLSHHVTSLHLHSKLNRSAMVTRDTLRPMRDLPRLTALKLALRTRDDVGLLMQGLTLDTAVAALRAVLPTQLRSFSVVLSSWHSLLGEPCAAPASSFWASVSEMAQLTELSIEQYSERILVRPELTQLPHLRKLTLGPAGEKGEHVAELKQLSQLREFILYDHCPDRIRLLFQPPHALQLESVTLVSFKLVVDEATMRALVHLQTLKTLDVYGISPEAWPLLPQLPLLCRLSVRYNGNLPLTVLPSLCASLSCCAALEDLTLLIMFFISADGILVTEEQKRAGWSSLLSSVPNLRRLHVDTGKIYVLCALPLHVPVLNHLVLSNWCDGDEAYFVHTDSFKVHLLELVPMDTDSKSGPSVDVEVRSWMGGGERLPKIERSILRRLRSIRSVGLVAEAGDALSLL